MSQEPVQLDLLDRLASQPPGPTPAASSPQAVDLPADAEPLRLIRVDLSCNMRRFYSVALATSLFGVVRQWGRIGSQGQSRTDWYKGPEPAELARQKRQPEAAAGLRAPSEGHRRTHRPRARPESARGRGRCFRADNGTAPGAFILYGGRGWPSVIKPTARGNRSAPQDTPHLLESSGVVPAARPHALTA